MNIIIFSGTNDRAIISFCRYALQKEIPIHIVANGDTDFILDTIYKKNVIAIRVKNELNINSILAYCESIKKDINDSVLIIPSTEYLNRFLLENRKILSENNIEIGLCNKEVYETISDKYLFNQVCLDEGIAVPKEYQSPPDFYPYVIKPKQYYSTSKAVLEKPALIYNQLDFEKFSQNKKKSDYYYQEFVEGKSYYLLYYIFKNGEYSVYSQENLIQQENGGSMILCKSASIHENIISQDFANLFIKLGFSGLAMVEVKYHKNKFYMIEANPRFWGPSQLILDASMNLFDCFALENNLISSLPSLQYKKDQIYFWSGGIVQTKKNKKNLNYHNFNASMFIENYDDFLNNEIYLKSDTINIYLKENVYE